MIDQAKDKLPGLALAAVCAALAYAISLAVPLLSAMLIAIFIGIFIRNIGWIPQVAEPGMAVAGKTVLRAGVVLLGLRLSIPQVLELGWGVVAVITLTVAGTYVASLALGRLMRLPHAVTVLTATGTAICGAAAVAAMSAVVKGDDNESVEEAAATAIASVTLFGTIGLIVVPWLGQAIGLEPNQIGVWIGAAVHEVGQVVAGAGIAQNAQPDSQVGAMLVDTALVTKLGRVVLLAPLVAIIGAIEASRHLHRTHPDGSKTPVVPYFVLGFLAMVIVRSVTNLPESVTNGVNTIATILFTMAMVAMGSGVRLKKLASTGGRALLMGGITGIVSALISLVGLYVLV
ncbi:YeiH family protein [Stomatohabitans albus]|uniref:YeiH family protein n=1 Tax=Stomatohabitans albus TaxID=3110766 RepID=UPI00300C60D7